jgi:hypothetical protein
MLAVEEGGGRSGKYCKNIPKIMGKSLRNMHLPFTKREFFAIIGY